MCVACRPLVVFAEPMLNEGSAEIEMLDDGWTFITKSVAAITTHDTACLTAAAAANAQFVDLFITLMLDPFSFPILCDSLCVVRALQGRRSICSVRRDDPHHERRTRDPHTTRYARVSQSHAYRLPRAILCSFFAFISYNECKLFESMSAQSTPCELQLLTCRAR